MRQQVVPGLAHVLVRAQSTLRVPMIVGHCPAAAHVFHQIGITLDCSSQLCVLNPVQPQIILPSSHGFVVLREAVLEQCGDQIVLFTKRRNSLGIRSQAAWGTLPS